MRVLVTGGAGYIGSHTCKALALAGHTPAAYDNLSRGNKGAVKWGPLFEGNIADLEKLKHCLKEFQPEAVIHFAAFAYVGESFTQPDIYWRNNVCGTQALLDALQYFEVPRLVFSSSCATYGIPETMPISEQAAQRPINPYGRTKLVCEQMITDYAQLGKLGAVMLRYFNAAGCDPAGEIGEDHDPETHLIPLVLKAAQKRHEPISVFGTDYPTPDGTCVRDFVHVCDLAAAHVIAIEHCEKGTSKAFNLGTGNGYSVSEIIACAERVTGRNIARSTMDRRPGDPPILIADATAARDILRWLPVQSDIETIIHTAWKWMSSRSAHDELNEGPKAS
jgi:UDP-arabinose 4-epimerase